MGKRKTFLTIEAIVTLTQKYVANECTMLPLNRITDDELIHHMSYFYLTSRNDSHYYNNNRALSNSSVESMFEARQFDVIAHSSEVQSPNDFSLLILT
ncbi:CLUMA_CG009827, isoform A [Clunio marinus]|uniref:CLUMA_CG009827, isoform A n=1 Tax=Clunio marinus TaxID=568069 RepID=A0A1J1I869_9DIPT|nr:CLUMA_CG009827, isoform A [Clunio marinus]